MTCRFFQPVILTIFLLAGATAFCAAQSNPDPPVPDEQNQAWRDTLNKMRIKREEEEHKKLLQTAAEVKDQAESLRAEMKKGRLSRGAEKMLKEIEKGAKRIRSESGGGDSDHELEIVPASLEDALKQLAETAAKLQTGMEKTSRHIVSFSVMAYATEVIQLVKILRGYLN